MNKIQRESWVVITVTMRSSSTAVLAALLNLEPLNMIVKTGAEVFGSWIKYSD